MVILWSLVVGRARGAVGIVGQDIAWLVRVVRKTVPKFVIY